MNEASDAKDPKTPDTNKKRRWPMHLLRVVLGVGVGLAITEVAFRARDGGAFAHINLYVPDAELGVRLKPGATEKVRFGSEKNPITSVRINGEGYRGDTWPSPSADEIVVVGDSQTFGLGVEESETFSSVLQTTMGGKTVVRNLGVPTYGPKEYNAVLAEQLQKRPAKTVIWIANMVNDLFEAERPNKTRHVVWDGWAVRAESAPGKVTSFPGRSFLYTDSHAFLAFRRWMYNRGPQDSDQGFASEGTWKDIGSAANEARNEHAGAELEAQRQAKLHANDIKDAKEAAARQTANVDSVIRSNVDFDDFGVGEGSPEHDTYVTGEQIFRAARLSPGDIVTGSGETERDVKVNAEQIRRGVALRNRLEKKAREKAARDKDKKSLDAFVKSEEIEANVERLESQLPAKPIVLSPLTPALKEAKAICDKAGARLVVVALPIDVQVSTDEWKKYLVENPVDMSPSRVLNQDVVAAAESIGAEGYDALPALAAAEPGAFLDADIHMTPKGHRALAEGLAKALKTPRIAKPDDAMPLPSKRSRPPLPEEWKSNTEIAVTESDPAGCETKQVREWLGIFCRGKGGAKGVKVDRGTEVLAGALPGQAVLVAPMIPGQDVHAVFSFGATSREFTAKMDGDTPKVAFAKAGPAHPEISGPPDTTAYCTCGKECSKLTAPVDADCTRTYANDCPKMLACAAGGKDAAPTCPEGQAHYGAAQRCRPLCSKELPCATGTCTPWQGGSVCL